MNKNGLLSMALGVAFLGTNVYWRQRERTVRESLTSSRNWQDANEQFQPENVAAAREAAEILNARLEDLPERVERVDEERRDLRRELDRVRSRWIDAWWDARSTQPIEIDEPHVLAVTLQDGAGDDVKQFAKRAMDHEQGITIVSGGNDGSFAVAVGESLTETFSAEEIAGEIAATVDGGAGGNDRLATGGGAATGLRDSIEATRERLAQTSALS